MLSGLGNVVRLAALRGVARDVARLHGIVNSPQARIVASPQAFTHTVRRHCSRQALPPPKPTWRSYGKAVLWSPLCTYIFHNEFNKAEVRIYLKQIMPPSLAVGLVTGASVASIVGRAGSKAFVIGITVAATIASYDATMLRSQADTAASAASAASVTDEEAKRIRAKWDAIFGPLYTTTSMKDKFLPVLAGAKQMWLGLNNMDENAKTLSRDALVKPEKIKLLQKLAEQQGSNMTEEQLKGVAEAIFELFDLDHNGVLTFEEFSFAFITSFALSMLSKCPMTVDMFGGDEVARLDYVFACIDANSSGYLEKGELIAFIKVIRKLGGVLPDDAKCSPKGHSGILGPTDLAEKWLKETDTNRDDKISRLEFSKLGPKLQIGKVLQQLA